MSKILLRAEGVCVRRGLRPVVRGVTLEAAAGEIVLIVGHNGSGKSTLLNALAGLLPIESGSVHAAGGLGSRAFSVLLQGESLFLHLSAIENTAAQALGCFRPRSQDKRDLEAQVIAQFPELKGQLRRTCAELSGGMRQLVALSGCVLSDHPIKLLDEPSVGVAPSLAPRALSWLRDRIRARGQCALIVEHNVALVAPFADRLCVLNNGEVVYNGSPSLLDDGARFRALYL